jgi:hypothetical protein
MSSVVIFHGNERESLDLAQIVARNCTCASTTYHGHPCPVHHMLSTDQRAIDGLVFVRRTCDRFVRAEHSPFGGPPRIPGTTNTPGRYTC